MYNTGRYNLQPFNTASVETGDNVVDTVNIACTILSAVYRGGNLVEEAEINAQTGSKLMLNIAIFSAAQWSGVTQCVAIAYADEISAAQAAAAYSCALAMHLDAYEASDMANLVRASAQLYATTYERTSIAETFGQYGYLSNNVILPARELSVLFDAQIVSILFYVQNAEFEIDIPPGSTLVIDSSNYVVLLDGEDVIYCQSGDWLFLNRNTYDVFFDLVGGESASKRVLYTERWL